MVNPGAQYLDYSRIMYRTGTAFDGWDNADSANSSTFTS
jgi:hypothetical protein